MINEKEFSVADLVKATENGDVTSIAQVQETANAAITEANNNTTVELAGGKELDDITSGFDLDSLTNDMMGKAAEADIKNGGGFDAETSKAIKDAIISYGNDIATLTGEYGAEQILGKDTSAKKAIVDDGYGSKPTRVVESIAKKEAAPTVTEEAVKVTVVKNRTEARVSTAVSGDIEKIKNRRRKGKSAQGLLFTTNMMTKVYDMDTPFKRQEIGDSIERAALTTFHNSKMLKDMLDHTSIIAADGATYTNEAMLNKFRIDDINDYLMLVLIASNEDNIIKNFPIYYDPKEDEKFVLKDDDGTILDKSNLKPDHFFVDIDIMKVYESTLTPEYINRIKLYDKTKTVEELYNQYDNNYTKKIEIVDKSREEVIKIQVSGASFRKYFALVESIKHYTVEHMINKYDNIADWIIEADQTTNRPFEYRGLDEKLGILATMFKDEYMESIGVLTLIYFMDKIEIYPKAYIDDVEAKESDYADEIIKIDIIATEFDVIKEIFRDFKQEVWDAVANATEEFEAGARGPVVINVQSPKYGVVVPINLEMTELFFAWTNKETLVKRAELMRKNVSL